MSWSRCYLHRSPHVLDALGIAAGLPGAEEHRSDGTRGGEPSQEREHIAKQPALEEQPHQRRFLRWSSMRAGPAYGTSKTALDHLTRSLAVERGPDGIRVNAVLPWFTRTEMVEKVLEDGTVEEKLIAATRLRRLAEPADIVRAAAFLSLPDSDYITGQLLAVDGAICAGAIGGLQAVRAIRAQRQTASSARNIAYRQPLAGEVEIDESYVGGPEPGKPGRAAEKKAIVAAAVEKRGKSCGRVRLGLLANVSASTLIGFVQKHLVATKPPTPMAGAAMPNSAKPAISTSSRCCRSSIRPRCCRGFI